MLNFYQVDWQDVVRQCYDALRRRLEWQASQTQMPASVSEAPLRTIYFGDNDPLPQALLLDRRLTPLVDHRTPGANTSLPGPAALPGHKPLRFPGITRNHRPSAQRTPHDPLAQLGRPLPRCARLLAGLRLRAAR